MEAFIVAALCDTTKFVTVFGAASASSSTVMSPLLVLRTTVCLPLKVFHRSLTARLERKVQGWEAGGATVFSVVFSELWGVQPTRSAQGEERNDEFPQVSEVLRLGE